MSAKIDSRAFIGGSSFQKNEAPQNPLLLVPQGCSIHMRFPCLKGRGSAFSKRTLSER
jgi:hypothetical protein